MNMYEFEREKYALEQATGGKNTLVLDDLKNPSVMVRVPKMRWCDIIEGGSSDVCDAFIVNGKELDCIYISKYPNFVVNGRGYSQAMKTPAQYVTYDQAIDYCESKGKGWHLMTNAEWAAIAHWCRTNETIPHGNNCGGVDIDHKHEHGINSGIYWTREGSDWSDMAYKVEDNIYYFHGQNLTGTGPATWNHDWTPSGITDLNGNTWEWVGGLRLMDGEFQIIPDNNAAAGVDQTKTSNLWRAINTNGNLVNPGAANTYKVDNTTAGKDTQESTHIGAPIINTVVQYPNYTGGSTEEYYHYSNRPFQALVAATGVTIHQKMKNLALFPCDSDHQGDYFYTRNYGERLPLRGGAPSDGASAGVFALHLSYARSLSSWYVGFRSAFVSL